MFYGFSRHGQAATTWNGHSLDGQRLNFYPRMVIRVSLTTMVTPGRTREMVALHTLTTTLSDE